MEAQLDKAYELIKDGQTDEALRMLESIIRENRDNDDAWWLYANAVTDADAKRNALNNILRIGTNEAREEKVRFMLAQLDDPNAIPDDFKVKSSSAKRKMSTGAKIALGVIGILGMCACMFLFVGFSAAMKVLYIPVQYDNQGSIVEGEFVSGYVDTDGDLDGYTFTAEADDEVVVTIRPDGRMAPYALLYTPDGTFMALSNEASILSNENATVETYLRERLPVDGEYTIIVRTIMGFGAGDYSMKVLVNP